MIYAYGIINFNGKISESIRGLNNACVYNISYCDIGIAASDLDFNVKDYHAGLNPVRSLGMKESGDERLSRNWKILGTSNGVNKDHVLVHEEVIEKLMEDYTVLPFRFFTICNKKEDVLSIVVEYYNDFRKNLDRLCGKVEYGIKIIWHGDMIRERIISSSEKVTPKILESTGSPAKKFMKQEYEKYWIDKKFEEKADQYIAVIDDVLSQFAVEKKLEKLRTKDLLLNANYLVKKEKQNEFREAFKNITSIMNELQYLIGGPWPPYNFIVLSNRNEKLSCFGKFHRNFVNKDAMG